MPVGPGAAAGVKRRDAVGYLPNCGSSRLWRQPLDQLRVLRILSLQRRTHPALVVGVLKPRRHRAAEQREIAARFQYAPLPDAARHHDLHVLPAEDVSFFQNFKNQFFGVYPMTIDKNGVLMTKDFDKTKFELIDQIIENQGDILSNQIPQALTTVISQRQPAPDKSQPQPVTQTKPPTKDEK